MRHALLFAAACLASACIENAGRPASGATAPQAPAASTPPAPAMTEAGAPFAAAAPAASAARDAGAASTVATPAESATTDAGALSAAAPGDAGRLAQPQDPSHPCTAGEGVRATVLGNGARPALQLEPDPGHGEALRVSEVDLDGLGQPDLYVLFSTNFGSDGALVQALYVHCSGDRYAPVWGPEYTLELKPLGTRTRSWLDVVRREKAGTPEAPTQKQVTLRFQGGTYEDARPEPEQP